MKKWNELYQMVEKKELNQAFLKAGYQDVEEATDRVKHVMEEFKKTFDFSEEGEVALCSAPGRTEIGGNHTDHQHGNVLAASVNLDFLSCVAPNGSNIVRFQSEGWPMTTIDITEVEPKEEEKETTESLVRGVFAELKKAGYPVAGCDIYAVSSVLPGSGLSSSAACEILLGVVGNHLFCKDELDAVTLAKIGQKAENIYFGKPSGLMDQTASSVGEAVAIDFKDPEAPVVRPVAADLKAMGLALCIVDSGADHAALTGEYAAIPRDMCKVAEYFGKKVLRDVNEEDFLNTLPEVRKAVGDQAVLRAMHFFADNKFAVLEADALNKGDKEEFLRIIRESGRSSWELLQNITPSGAEEHQDMAVALAAAEIALKGKGACRVHGGGFAGTLQAFVPLEQVEDFKADMEKMLKKGCCHVLNIRPAGGLVLSI